MSGKAFSGSWWKSRGPQREVTARLGLDRAEDIRGSATFVFAVVTRLATRRGERPRTNVGVEGDRLFVEANNRMRRIIRLFVGFEHIFHARDVSFIELGHAPHFFPATV